MAKQLFRLISSHDFHEMTFLIMESEMSTVLYFQQYKQMIWFGFLQVSTKDEAYTFKHRYKIFQIT